MIAIDLSRQNELDADPKTIQQKEFGGKLKQVMLQMQAMINLFVLMILEKIKKTRLTFSRGSVTVL